MRLLAASLAEPMPVTDVDRRPALEVRQGEVHPSVAAERSAEQREQRLVLVDGQELPVAEGPPLRRKDKAHDSDLGQEWFSHRHLLIKSRVCCGPPAPALSQARLPRRLLSRWRYSSRRT